MIYNRYKKYRKAIKYPDGTIEYIVPFEEKKGELISQENFESLEDCLYNYQYRWYTMPLNNEDSNTFICEGYAQYYKEVYQKSTDNEHWVDVEPKQERKGDLVKEYSEACGYVPLTEWRLVEFDLSNPDSYICEFFSLYKKEVEYISYDNGTTYEPSGNVRKGDLIEENSETCGYDPIISESFIATAKTTSSSESIAVTFKQEYFDNIVIDGEDIKKVNGSGVLIYKGNNPGEYVFYYKEIDNLTTCDYMFKACHQITKIDATKLNVSNVISMSHMFENCYNLETVKVDSWNTSNVTDMSYMFYSCDGIVYLDLSNFDTSNVTNMTSMFEDCYHTKYLNISNWDLRNVTNIDNFFGNAVYMENLIMDNVIMGNFNSAFIIPPQVKNISLSNVDTSMMTTMRMMFQDCYASNIDLSSFDTSNVTNMASMFERCLEITTLDLSSFDTSNVTNMGGMFSSSSIKYLDLSNFNTSNVTNMTRMFYGCGLVTSLDLSNFDTSNVTDMSEMFRFSSKLMHIRCKQAFKDWCLTNQDTINLPEAMREGGSGTWEIV